MCTLSHSANCVGWCMDTNEIYWAITFLMRTVARGEAETDALVHLVAKLSDALKVRQSIPLAGG